MCIELAYGLASNLGYFTNNVKIKLLTDLAVNQPFQIGNGIGDTLGTEMFRNN